MYLSRLELIGFKSFAQKTKLKFSDGISCVIGPNGSGKSNIVDAIRWVLGEQKVTSLRTDRMESVIFNGSKERKALSMAEVSLTVHNNRNVLSSEFTDVVISRRLYRSGESQYFINSSPCRLKDIQDLFMDTGMGSNSYSVIELGMVESIISENPSERRHLFEEAAGVTKYKIRRKSALRKLDLTHQDMSRIEDIITEITRNVNSLSRQVGKARRYLRFQEELKKIDVDLARYHYTHHIEDMEPLRTTLDEISLIKEDASQQITLEEAILEEYKRELIQYEQQITDFSKRQREHDEKLHQIKEQNAIALTRSQYLNENIKRNQKDIEEYNGKLSVLEQKITRTEQNFNQSETVLKQLQSDYNIEEKELQRMSQLLQEKKNNVDSLNQSYKEQLNKVLKQKEDTQQLTYQISWNKEQLRIFDVTKADLAEAKSGYQQKLNEIKKIKAEKTEEKNGLQKEINQLVKENQQTIAKLNDLEGQIIRAAHQHENLDTQLTFYNDILSNYQGHLESTRELMKTKNQFPGLHGPISDIINTDEKYAQALEIALGETVNYLVVDTGEAAHNILRQVENKKLGRVTLVPLDRLNKLKLPKSPLTQEKDALINHVRCKSEHQTIIDVLLGDVIVLNTLSDAIVQSEKRPGLRYVTLNGEIITKFQAISGGQKQNSKTSLIGRKELINKLREQINELEQNTVKKEEESSLLRREQEKITTKINDLQSTMGRIEERITELNKSETEVQVQNETNQKTILKGEDEKKETFALVIRLEKEVTRSKIILTDLENELTALESEIFSLSEAHSSNESEVQRQSDRVKELNVQLINATNQHKNHQTEISRLKTDVSELKQLIEKREREIEEMEKEIIQIDVDTNTREETQTELWKSHEQLENDKSKIEQEYHEIRDKIINLENQIKKYRKQHDTSLERTRQLELEIQEHEMKSEVIRERIKNEYNEDITIGIPYDGLNIQESEKKIESLKMRIRQMGQVNPLAVSEYERESERLEFFTKQYNDLKDAEKSLLETINKINITARNQFTETFERIKKNFERVFANFFVNGEGTLRIDESNDPLEANIEILVRPKGKRMQTISLLSGGEKTLTAISLLFSIYLVKPSPFCILDEIDAPLDDVNIGRFTKALADFSTDTQFIVVTHNKRTMEAANTLYGVTMEEEGLSKLVSVKFN